MNADLLTIDSYGDGAELILIHGFGWNSTIWQPILEPLCLHHRVHVVQLPKILDDLKKLAAAIADKCPNPATWLGWSIGGLIALQAAADYPNQVKKLILVASSPCFMEKNNWPGITQPALEQMQCNLQTNKLQAIKKFVQLQTNGNYPLTQALNVPTYHSDYDQSGLTLLKNSDLTRLIEHIRCPILGIFGKKDRLVPQALSTLLAQYMDIQLFDSAHLPFYEQPHLFIKTINEFTQNAA